MMLRARGGSRPFFRLVDEPARHMSLAVGELHVWSGALQIPESLAMECLSTQERERAARFASTAPRRRYVAGRAILRGLLDRYTGIPARDIVFGYQSQGKPFLKTADNGPELRFNLSHSGDLALFAFSRTQAVGIDLEYLRPVEEAELIARRTFSRIEYEQLMMVEGVHARLHAFYSCWTRKEAFIKALGTGLSFPLDHFAVSIGADKPARVLSILNDQRSAECWTLYHLEPDPNYIGAVAIEGPAVEISGFMMNHPHLFLTEILA
jgi:4'-phosphopantetheinyl transferase